MFGKTSEFDEYLQLLAEAADQLVVKDQLEMELKIARAKKKRDAQEMEEKLVIAGTVSRGANKVGVPTKPDGQTEREKALARMEATPPKPKPGDQLTAIIDLTRETQEQLVAMQTATTQAQQDRFRWEKRVHKQQKRQEKREHALLTKQFSLQAQVARQQLLQQATKFWLDTGKKPREAMKLAQQMVAASADPTTTNESASSPDFQSDSTTEESSDEAEPEQNVETTPVAQKQTEKCAWKEKCVSPAATKWVYCFGDACTEKVHNLCCSKNAGPQEPGKTYCPKCVPERKVKRVAKRKVTLLVGGEKTQQLRRSSRRRKVVSSCLLLVCLLVLFNFIVCLLTVVYYPQTPKAQSNKAKKKTVHGSAAPGDAEGATSHEV